MNCVFFARRKEALWQFLKAGGVGAPWQVAGEYLAYLCLVGMGLLALCLPLSLLLERGIMVVPEWEGMGAAPFWAFVGSLIPVTIMFAAGQFFLFEAADGIVNGILMQLLCGIGMGYLSGYFYPSSFFPERMRVLGDFLPSGAAARFVEAGLFGKASAAAVMPVFMYTAVFLILAAAVRGRRTGREWLW